MGAAIELIAADAALSLTASNNKQESKGDSKAKNQKPKEGKLAFRKVISVASTLSMIALGGYWVYRLASGNAQNQTFFESCTI